VATFSLFVRMLVALGVTLGLLYAVARVARAAQGRGLGRRHERARSPARRPPIEVLARRALSRSSGISIVRVGRRVFVLATAHERVECLGELQPGELEEQLGQSPPGTAGSEDRLPSAWDAAISTLRELTVRR
jgi:flagellar biogenesis protein FliO